MPAKTLLLLLLLVSPLTAADVAITPDVVYGHKYGLAMTFDVFTPKEKANGAGVLFMVSGGWHSRWINPAATTKHFQHLTDEGFTVFSVRHGSSPKFNIPEVAGDVRRAVRFVRLNAKRFGVDPDRLGVFGYSAGGHLSLLLGTASDEGTADAKDPVLRVSDRVAAVVDYFGPSDLVPWVTPESPYYKNYPALQFEAARAKEFSPLYQVSKDDAPTLLLHGDADKLVPLDHSERILKEFQKAEVPAELIVFKGAGHGFGGEDAEKARVATAKWFKEHLLED
jgi:acetyl esterase/lipase